MKIDTSYFEKVIAKSSGIAIIGHINPDGDSVGSVTALFHYLTFKGKNSVMILPNEYPVNLAFLDPRGPSGRRIMIDEEQHGEVCRAIQSADAIICLDMSSLNRAGGVKDAVVSSQAPKILIDHHLNPAVEQFDQVYSNTEISSASELLFWIIMNLPSTGGDVRKIPMKTARSIYVGMMTDTNNFSNSVYPSTFEMASGLIARGVDRDTLQTRVMGSFSFHRMKLMGHLLKDKLKIVNGTGAAYMVLTEKEKRSHRYRQGDSEGFVNLPLQIKSVKISALFTEDAENGYMRVSFRSKGTIDVNSFARAFFNGGGHRNAAGGRLSVPVEDVPAYFEDALKKFFKA